MSRGEVSLLVSVTFSRPSLPRAIFLQHTLTSESCLIPSRSIQNLVRFSEGNTIRTGRVWGRTEASKGRAIQNNGTLEDVQALP